ncbi:MAG TPA: cupredoxin family protein [Burkholderiales bacterium]
MLLAILLLGAGAAAAHGDPEHAARAPVAAAGEEYDFGRAGDARKATRTVRVDMSDKMRFSPASLTVRQGETVKFVVHNGGKTMHEMVIGTMPALTGHAEAMKKHPTMEHDDAFGAHVAPGKTGTIVWQFTKPGQFHYGCLVPGHLEAGMVGQITVQSR